MNFDQILTNLYLGSTPREPGDIVQLKKAGVSAVLSLQTDEDLDYLGIDWDALTEEYGYSEIEICRVPIEDFNADDLVARIPNAVDALHRLTSGGHTAFVHCNAGANRSPTTVIAWLHWVHGWELHQALSHVLKCRFCDPFPEVIRAATPAWQASRESA